MRKLFPKGRAIAVIEPFFKVRQDTTASISVDDPTSIADWSYPLSCLDWKLLGNTSIQSKPCNPESAVVCYTPALNRSDGVFLQAKSEIALLCNNSALCDFRARNWLSLVWYAGVATRLDSTNAKAWFRLMAALVQAARAQTTCFEAAFAAKEILKDAHEILGKQSSKEWYSLQTNVEDSKESALGLRGRPSMFNGEASWCIVPGVVECGGALPISKPDRVPELAISRETGRALFKDRKYQDAKAIYTSAIPNLQTWSKPWLLCRAMKPRPSL